MRLCSLVGLAAMALAGSSGCHPAGTTTAPAVTSDAVDPSPTPDPSSELAAMTLPSRPDWADKYAGSAPDERFFDIAALMDAHGLSRAHAVELQNHFRDLTRAQPDGDRETQYAEALRRAQAGVFEDGRDLSRLAQAPFIVVFDLDETLYDQHIRDPKLAATCRDFTAPRGDGRTRNIKLNPGWADAIHRIHARGGAVVIFSANVDDTCYRNAAAWELDGKPLLEHPAIAAFLTNSHLVLQPKHAGSPVVEPSKDLRIVDPTLQKTIIVDDNPRRLFQFRNVRTYKKFLAEPYCTSADPAVAAAHDRGLAVVVEEIEDALDYMESHPGTGFAHAYLPYTTLGRLAVQWLRQGATMSEAAAIEHLRAHPQLADDEF